MLRPFGHPVACCCVSFGVVTQSLKPVKFFSQQLPTFLTFRFRRSVAQQCWIRLPLSNIVGTTQAHYTCPGLQSLMGCILPTMHCRSQHCWELLHPFVHHCQHGRNNSQHCWATMLGIFACVCKPLQTRTHQLPTLLAQQCWEFVRSFTWLRATTHV